MTQRQGPERHPVDLRPPLEPRVVILTGVSGSGKSTALRALEDAGFYCVDNLPIVFLEKLLELSAHTAGEVTRIALVVDAREGRFLAEAPRVIEEVRRRGTRVDVVFLDATDDALLRRYSETRRRHPLGSGSVPEGIAAERKALEGLKAVADEVVDSSSLNVHELKRLVHGRFVEGAIEKMGVTVVSFGFRYGLPSHADVVLDVRFLPNPYFVPELKPYPGTDERVRDYVLGQPDARAFLDRSLDLCNFLLPRYRAEGKSYLTIAIGCTGGRHRSVAIAAAMASALQEAGTDVRLWHRDLEKE
ncbi:RNase adapter RapZ [Anaeromyxobacter diazotrophicus]|uniref:Nucleotide-binding protein n=1 Tax=Anaeromyxobacter diazotrophicus TaxID=2590199 RepID=A0A7I9VQD2_9BACT|nr:RNase adapter RapZ [Anaeromyxobacter diazotrophicus]GEJ58626.1 nucleotide-binding protein [Anaeromyxobacter diazotrophicus]